MKAPKRRWGQGDQQKRGSRVQVVLIGLELKRRPGIHRFPRIVIMLQENIRAVLSTVDDLSLRLACQNNRLTFASCYSKQTAAENS